MSLGRTLFAVIVACATPAFAQQAPEAPAAPVSAESVEAGHAFFNAMMFESGAMAAIFDGVATAIVPDLRRSIMDSSVYGDASPEHQRSVLAFVETLPDLIERELTTEIHAIAASAAPRLALRMSADDLRQTAAFLRSPEMRPQWQALARAAIDAEGEGDLGTFPEWASVGSFASTPAGQAFAREEDAIAALLEEEFEVAMRRMAPRLRVAVSAGMCDALADDCPAHIRDSLGRI
jgi:NAD(P)H-dependent FMN reductase